MLQQSQMFPHFPLSQPDYTNLAVGPDEQRQVVALGLWLFSHGGSPIAVLQRDANPRYGRQSASLEVLAGATDHSGRFLVGVPTADAAPQCPQGPDYFPGDG